MLYDPINRILTMLAQLDNRLDRLTRIILGGNIRQMATLQDIQNAVAAEKTVEDSVIILLQQVSAELQAAIAANDPVAMQALVDQINADAQAMADAVVANTPAPPPVTP